MSCSGREVILSPGLHLGTRVLHHQKSPQPPFDCDLHSKIGFQAKGESATASVSGLDTYVLLLDTLIPNAPSARRYQKSLCQENVHEDPK